MSDVAPAIETLLLWVLDDLVSFPQRSGSTPVTCRLSRWRAAAARPRNRPEELVAAHMDAISMANACH